MAVHLVPHPGYNMTRFYAKNTLTALVLAALATSAATTVMAQTAQPPRFDFAAIDADKDGNVTKAEVEAFQLAQITAMDSDADGSISVDEMTAHHTAMMQANIESRAKTMSDRMMKRLDADSDGTVSIAEMAARKGGDKMFNRMDDNSDGMISQDEYAAAEKKMEKHGRRGGGHGGEHRGGHKGGGFWGKSDT